MNKIFLLILTFATSFAFAEEVKETAKTTEKAKEVKEEAKSPIGFSLYTELSLGLPDAHQGRGDALGSYNDMSLSYKLSENEKISYSVIFTTSQASFDKNGFYDVLGMKKPNSTDSANKKPEPPQKVSGAQQFKNSDHYIKYSNSKTKLFGKELPAAARVYIPTSAASDLVGRYKLRTDLSIPVEINKTWSLTYIISPRYSFYTKSDSGQTTLETLLVAGLEQSVTEKFSMSYAVGLYNSFSNTGNKLALGPLNMDGSYEGTTNKPIEDNNSNTLILDLGASYQVNKNLGLSLTLEQSRNLEESGSYLPFRESNTNYLLGLTASL